MLSTLRAARALSPTARLLLVNQFGVYVGFYLLVPYLATHLHNDLGLSAGVVGAVIGVRSLSQQGLTLFGGSAADRIGCRPLVITGCALRAVGFALFALFQDVPGLFAASILTGLAGAIFSPATRAYLAHEAGERRLSAFALFNVAGEAGTLVGPLLGSALLFVSFRLVAIVAAGVFAVLTVAQWFVLPPRPPEPAAQSVLADWRETFANRRFLGYVCATSGVFVLYNQLYLTLPLEARRVSGMDGVTAFLFTASTIVTLGLQIRVTNWCRRHWSPGTTIGVGLALCGAAFVPLTISGSLQQSAPHLGRHGVGALLGAIPVITPVLLATLLLTFGVVVAQPFALDLAPDFGRGGLTGTYLGAFAMASGIGAVLGNSGVGYVSDLGNRIGAPWLAWLLLAGYGLACAALVLWMRARALLPRRPPASAGAATDLSSVS